MKNFFYALMFLLPTLFLQAHHEHDPFVGTYQIEGFNPYTGNNYVGAITISQTGETYLGQWVYGNGSTEVGTGVREDNQLSFIFVDTVDPAFTGVQVYELRHDGHLRGPWAYIGGTLVGEESLTPVHDHHSHCH